MAKGTIGGKIVLEGENEYRAALKNIKTGQAELRSEMKLCQTTFKESQNSLEALSQKHEILTKQVETQTKKVEIYQQAMATSTKKEQEAAKKVEDLQTALKQAEKEMQAMADSSEDTSGAMENQTQAIEELKQKLKLAEQNFDKASQKTISYKTAVNNAQAELQNLQHELDDTEKYIKEASNTTDKCATSIDKYGKEIKEASEEALSFGDVMKANIASGVVLEGLERLKDLAKEAGQALVDCAIGAAQYADDIATTSANTGIAVETLQELTYAQELMDVSLDTVTSTMAKNIRSMESARKGTADYVAAYEKLGVEIENSNGELRDSEAVFWEVVDALGAMENETARDAVAMQLFGRSAQDLNSLIKIGSKGFQELAGEAHQVGFVLSNDALNGLLKTSDTMERMKNRVTAVKNNIGAELAPIFEKSFDRIGDAVEDAEDGIIDFAEDAIPMLVTGLEWIIDNADIVASGIAGITTATLYHSTIAPAIVSITTAWKAYQKANEGATVSQWLLNTAMNANPAGLLITAVTGLTAAVTAYTIINKDNWSTTDEVTKVTLEQVEAAKELNKTYANSVAERSQARQNMENETIVAKSLVTELEQLESKTQLTVTEQTRMRMIVEELNQAIPEMNLAIDEQTGKLNLSTDAIFDNVEAMMAMSKVQHAREELTEIAEQQWEAEKKLVDLQEQLEKQLLTTAEIQKELYSTESQWLPAEDYQEIAHRMKESTAAQSELQQQIDATQKSISGFTVEYEEALKYIADNEAIVQAALATQDLGDSAQVAGEQMSGMSAEVQAAFNEMYADLSEVIKNQMNLFDEFQSKSQLTTDELLKNMQSQVDGITKWSENLSLLGERGINQGLLQYLADMGPEGAAYVATFVEMTDEELKKANLLYEQSLLLPGETATTIAEAYVEAGKNVSENFKSGIEENSEAVQETVSSMAEDTVTVAQENLGESHTLGGQFVDGIIKGIVQGKPKTIHTVTQMDAEIISVARAGLQTSIFTEMGKQIPAGLKAGIESGANAVIRAVEIMCSDAVKKGKTELDINSPSGKFEYLGEMSGEGYKGGWKNSMANIDEVIAMSLPDTSMNPMYGSNRVGEGLNKEYSETAKIYNINQQIGIYSPTDDLIETSRKFKQSQKEAAAEW